MTKTFRVRSSGPTSTSQVIATVLLVICVTLAIGGIYSAVASYNRSLLASWAAESDYVLESASQRMFSSDFVWRSKGSSVYHVRVRDSRERLYEGNVLVKEFIHLGPRVEAKLAPVSPGSP